VPLTRSLIGDVKASFLAAENLSSLFFHSLQFLILFLKPTHTKRSQCTREVVPRSRGDGITKGG